MEPRLRRPAAPAPRRRGQAAIARLARSPVTSRVVVFTGADMLTTALGGIVTLLLARSLSTTQYGSYSFATSALAFTAMFFEFGLFLPTARRLAQGRGHPGEVVGAATTAYLLVGVAFVVLVFALSFGVDNWFHVDAGAALRLVAPLLLVYPYEFVALLLAQGLDRIRRYSLARMGGRAIAVATLGAVLLTSHRLTVALALAVESAALLLTWTAYTLWLRPAYRNLVPQVRGFLREARRYGFQVYVGRVLSIGTYNMDTLMVAAFTNARSVGFYALASAIAYPVGLPGAGLGAALFPRMAREPRLDGSWLLGAGLFSLAAAGVACVLVRPLVSLVVGSAYLPVVGLLPPLALAASARSVTSIYNTFLAAHARGAELRNASLVLTGSNLVLNIALIPPFGAIGAAWASLVALLCNLAAHVASYRSVVRELGSVAAP